MSAQTLSLSSSLWDKKKFNPETDFLPYRGLFFKKIFMNIINVVNVYRGRFIKKAKNIILYQPLAGVSGAASALREACLPVALAKAGSNVVHKSAQNETFGALAALEIFRFQKSWRFPARLATRSVAGAVTSLHSLYREF